ncbi:hypothetical protein BC936DRAFT_140000 [Jimgerdemannia flammicorona]|uniref:Uncharacterized protein n=1 Tax=Jimgerdemannia flammicorona TaxID=994334 RepID=A0A433B802_9FUNG|nr:hypothetical protein BC936DRAFT_140000 [Jimgerdemannia flammicorona]
MQEGGCVERWHEGSHEGSHEDSHEGSHQGTFSGLTGYPSRGVMVDLTLSGYASSTVSETFRHDYMTLLGGL